MIYKCIHFESENSSRMRIEFAYVLLCIFLIIFKNKNKIKKKTENKFPMHCRTYCNVLYAHCFTIGKYTCSHAIGTTTAQRSVVYMSKQRSLFHWRAAVLDKKNSNSNSITSNLHSLNANTRINLHPVIII